MIQPKTFLLIILKVNAALFCRRTHIMNSLINQKKGKKKPLDSKYRKRLIMNEG
jgi:hypothetical protein